MKGFWHWFTFAPAELIGRIERFFGAKEEEWSMPLVQGFDLTKLCRRCCDELGVEFLQHKASFGDPHPNAPMYRYATCAKCGLGYFVRIDELKAKE